MASSDQTIPNGISREDVLQAIRDFEAGVEHGYGASSFYDLVHEGKAYPPKAILGLAARRVAWRVLRPNEFEGGEGTRCFMVLRELGFDVLPKNEATGVQMGELAESNRTAIKTFETLLPDIELRTQVAKVFAGSITEANAVNPGSWALTFNASKGYVRLDAGRLFCLTVRESSLSVLLHPESINLSEPKFSSWDRPSKTIEFKSNPNLTWRQGPITEVIEHWGPLEQAHLAAIRQTAGRVAYSPYGKYHQPELCQEIGRLAGVELTQPIPPPLPVFEIDDIVWLMNRVFPKWTGFGDRRFEEAEVTYKKKAASRAQELLGKSELERLIHSENYDEVVSRLKKVAQDTNLLFLGVPSKGDLAIINSDSLPKSEFCSQMFELLHGEGDAADRLGVFLGWVEAEELPNKWTFPTYVLFLLHPDTEIFIKPGAVQSFLKLLDANDKLPPKPSKEEYGRVREVARGLFDSLAEFGPRDLMDIQGLMWVCGSIKFWKIAPGEGARLWDQQREGGYVGLGWDEVGDLSEVNKKDEFDERVRPFIERHDDWTNEGLKQLWAFRSQVTENDVVVANQGTSKVLGIGTVTGPYFFAEGEEFGHRVPVRWDDTKARGVDFGGWRRTLIELSPQDFKKILDAEPQPPEPIPDAVLSARAFELLGLLYKEPKKSVYADHRDEFHTELEQPFQQLMRRVARRLPQPILEVMETEKNIFSRIPKNDWGRGGAWPHYWGAFYPKGGKRIEDAQLAVWMNHEWMGIGFYIGEYGSEQRRTFVETCAANRQALEPVIGDYIDSDDLLFGQRDESAEPSPNDLRRMRDWRGWLQDPGSAGIRVEVVMPRNKVMSMPAGELERRIEETFARVFPLVLLATKDDPMPQIAAYLGLGDEEEVVLAEDYTLPQFASETNLPEPTLERWVQSLERKGQAVLYGPPGTGKTYVAERMARHLVGGGDGFFEIVQFHPAYAYEDFIQGIRPRVRPEGSIDFRLEPGRFLDFCARARKCRGTCVLIIDEINRANLSRVFGELMYLLEYRDKKVPLAGGGSLEIPSNVRVIGTMNTADRSIALVDHALRRRFAFIALYPQYEVLRNFHADSGFDPDHLIETLRRINSAIGDRHYEVGISFFLRKDLAAHLQDIWRMEIEPYLEEYFFDQASKVDEFRWERIAGKVLP